MKILAIDPGTRKLGVAVLDGEQLVYYAIKSVPRRRSPAGVLRRVHEITASLITRYRPDCLAIESMSLIQKSVSLLVVAAEEVKSTARQHNLPICEYAPTAVRKRLSSGDKATRRRVAELVASMFPELRNYLAQKTKWETLYYSNMFDAVALAWCCLLDKTSVGSSGHTSSRAE